jgi:hypothetical protein
VTDLNDSGHISFSEHWEFFIESKLEEAYAQAIRKVEKTIRNHLWGD